MRIGIDVGGTYIKAGAVNDNFQIVSRREIPYPKNAGYEKLADTIKNIVADLAAEMSIPIEEVDSVGVALPGILNRERSILLSACNLKIYNAPFKNEMEKRLIHTPVFLINDADAATLAEAERGVLKGCENALLLTLGTGVGSGMLINGRLFYDHIGQSAEIGHIPLFQNGLTCSCGRKGCVETLCSAEWLAKAGQKAAMENPDSALCSLDMQAEKISAKMVVDCARKGDAAAMNIFNRYIESLSHAIACCVSFIDFEVIALGGGVSRADDFLLEPLRKRVYEKLNRRCNIVAAFFKNDAGIYGAAVSYKVNSNLTNKRHI